MNKILRYTKEQRKFIEDNVKGRGNKELTDLFNKEFDTNFSVEKIKAYKYNHKLSSGLTGRFEKGQESWNEGKKCPQIKNKTSFKKGNVPVNHRSVGSVRVNADGYHYTKIEEPDKWELTHRLIWEQHYGEIRKDQCVIFLNGDKSNLDVTNLAVIERRDLVRLNQKGLITDDREATRSGIGIVKIENKIRDLEKGKKA